MTTPPSTPATPDAPAAEPYEKRWLALGVIAMTVLLVILDARTASSTSADRHAPSGVRARTPDRGLSSRSGRPSP